jgi:hypothetical protein
VLKADYALHGLVATLGSMSAKYQLDHQNSEYGSRMNNDRGPLLRDEEVTEISPMALHAAW